MDVISRAITKEVVSGDEINGNDGGGSTDSPVEQGDPPEVVPEPQVPVAIQEPEVTTVNIPDCRLQVVGYKPYTITYTVPEYIWVRVYTPGVGLGYYDTLTIVWVDHVMTYYDPIWKVVCYDHWYTYVTYPWQVPSTTDVVTGGTVRGQGLDPDIPLTPDEIDQHETDKFWVHEIPQQVVMLGSNELIPDDVDTPVLPSPMATPISQVGNGEGSSDDNRLIVVRTSILDDQKPMIAALMGEDPFKSSVMISSSQLTSIILSYDFLSRSMATGEFEWLLEYLSRHPNVIIQIIDTNASSQTGYVESN